MSELRSALDGLLVVDDATLSDVQLVADLDEVEHATRQLEVVRARRLGELERRSGAVTAISRWPRGSPRGTD